jgi:hypothetical protein
LYKEEIMARITAVFDDFEHAERAVDELRRRGVDDHHLSFIAHGERIGAAAGGARDREGGVGERVAKGAAAGAGAGLLFGLAALAIPGLGPFVTAGALASALGAGGATVATGAIVGGASGALATALTRAGYGKEEAEFYRPVLERGGILVAVETDGQISAEDARSILRQHGGRFYEG